MPNRDDDPSRSEDELRRMRVHVEELERALSVQQRISFAAGLFQSDVTVRTLLEALAEGVVVVDSMGSIVFVNKRAEAMFGYSGDEIVGHSLNALVPERFFQSHADYVSDYFDDPRIRPMGQGIELAATHKGGTEFPVEISLTHLQTKAGPLALAFITDISQRKQAERELLLRNEDLDAFAHTVAHDLKASLGVVVGFSEELACIHRDMPPEELEKDLSLMAQSGRKMHDIVEGLLLFATMRSKDVKVHPIDSRAIVASAMERLRYAIQEAEAEVTLPDSFPAALGISAWVEEVWFNYLSNGLKYGGKPPRLEIGGEPLEDGRVKFWVRDGGHGLTPDEQARLFHEFAQQSQDGQGHGLGLAIVQRIVTKLNGEVGVESEMGQGATFSFTLPAANHASGES